MFAPPSKRRGGPCRPGGGRGRWEEPGAGARPGPHDSAGLRGRPRRSPTPSSLCRRTPTPQVCMASDPRARAARTAPRTGAPRAAPASCRPRSSEDAALPGTVSSPDTPLARRHFRWLHGHPRRGPAHPAPRAPWPSPRKGKPRAPGAPVGRARAQRRETDGNQQNDPVGKLFRSPYKTQDFADAFCACMAWDPAVFLASVVWALFLQKVRGGGSGCPGPAGFGARLLTPRGRSAGPGGERPVYCLLVKTLREEREGKVTMSRK